MSGISTKFSYKQLHTLKHTLVKHMQRENVTEDDYKSEEVLLLKIIHQIDEMKERYDI